MKKKNKKNHIRMRFSTLLLCCLAIVLCAAPCAFGQYQYFTLYYDQVGEYDVTVDEINEARGEAGLEENGVLDVLEIGAGATVNLDTDVQSIYVYPGGILNIYSGKVGLFVVLTTGEQDPIVTVYGNNFEVDWECNGTFVSLDGADEFTPKTETGSVLKGFYGNGEPIPPGLYTLGLWFISSIPINLEPPPSDGQKEITIDIKPGNDDNSINLKSRGVIPVAVFTTDDFDASTIDPENVLVLFAGAEPVRWKLCDVDVDGDEDMLFHFKTQELNLDEGSTEATLTGTLKSTLKGETINGNGISGTDTVRIVSPKKK